MTTLSPPPIRDTNLASHAWQRWFASIAANYPSLAHLPKFATADAPPYEKGAAYFDTTLNKVRIGGATGWESITSV